MDLSSYLNPSKTENIVEDLRGAANTGRIEIILCRIWSPVDPDGVLEDEHVGDASIEGKLKKLCARARELQELPRTAAAAGQ